MSEGLLTSFSIWMAGALAPNLAGLMLLTFVAGALGRATLYYLLRSEERFCREFEKRVHRHLDREYPETRGLSFHAGVESLLKRTFTEIYQLRAQHLRRTLDRAAVWADRQLGVEARAQTLIEDTLRRARGLEPGQAGPALGETPRFAFGWDSPRLTGLNDSLNLLPGLFILAGLLGTLLGIMGGLPRLSGMDVSDLNTARATLDAFLGQMTGSLTASVMGLVLSGFFAILNVLLSPADAHERAVERFRIALELLWNDTHSQAAERAALGDPRTADLERHPEIGSFDGGGTQGTASLGPDTERTVTPPPTAVLPPPVPTSDEQRAIASAAPTAGTALKGHTPENLDAAMAAAAQADRFHLDDTGSIEVPARGEALGPGRFDPAAHEPPPYGDEDRTASFDRPAPPATTDEITDGAGFVPASHEPPAYGAENVERAQEHAAAVAEVQALREALAGGMETLPAPGAFGANDTAEPAGESADAGDPGAIEDGAWPVGSADGASSAWPPAQGPAPLRAESAAQIPSENSDYDDDSGRAA
ncbi:MAG: hypothetical protein IT285_02550 [Bdellovibrionales bacterium]|nr:hypothetical protein [Bdellovibrionales bacterium]